MKSASDILGATVLHHQGSNLNLTTATATHVKGVICQEWAEFIHSMFILTNGKRYYCYYRTVLN